MKEEKGGRGEKRDMSINFGSIRDSI